MDTTLTLWSISLVIGLVVIGVVAFLLHLIEKTADKIDDTAEEIWTQGKLIANDTIQIPLFLSKTNRVVGEVYRFAANTRQSAEQIRHHTEECPGCPHCMSDQPQR